MSSSASQTPGQIVNAKLLLDNLKERPEKKKKPERWVQHSTGLEIVLETVGSLLNQS